MKTITLILFTLLFMSSAATAKDFSLIEATPKAVFTVAKATGKGGVKVAKISGKAAKKAVVVSVVSVGKFLF